MTKKALYIFNPEHDLALASGETNYMAPASARRMASELALLPMWYAEEGSAVLAPSAYNLDYVKKIQELLGLSVDLMTEPELASERNLDIRPWGWDVALRKRLSGLGMDEALLPSMMIEDGHKTKVPENALNENFCKKEFQTLWNYINHKWNYTVHFDSDELIKKAVKHINEKLFVAQLQYTVTRGTQGEDWNASTVKSGSGFVTEKSHTYNIDRAETSQVKYDLIGKISAGTHLTRRTATAILKRISPVKFSMYKYNPEEFISKVIKLINEEKATMIVDDITYNKTDGTYDSSIFIAEKNKDFSKAYLAKKNVQDYVFADGTAEKSIERKFAEDMDLDDKVVVYAKLPRGFQIPTPVGNYAPDWAIAFQKGTVKHIYFVAETKGSMESLDLRPIEQAKIKCAKKLFNEISTDDVVYEQVDSYQTLLNVMDAI